MQEEIRQNLETQKESEEINTHISIDDFMKVEIKLGTVISAEVVEGSDKLLKLKVDFDESKEIESEGGLTEREAHTRTVFSGIRKFVSIEDIIGKQFPFVTNLQPRKMMGQYSEAMIMAASEKVMVGDTEIERFALLSPTQVLTNGVILK